MEVIIDGVVYVPKNEVPKLNDDRLKNALASLTEIQYFYECSHKHRAWAWEAMAALAPDIAELASNDTQAAYDLFHTLTKNCQHLKCWFAGSKDPHEYAYVEAVFANSHREARKIVWSKGLNIAEECDGDFTYLQLTRQKEFDGLASGSEPYVCTDRKSLRLMGWRMEGDGVCDSCGLASYHNDYPVCEECNQCCECEHTEDCTTKGATQ